jgi:4-amino-4-deoxy-L-arabinose transferase-like glycosyltransferase
MAGSLSAFRLAEGGGYSGELVSSGLTEFALRLPFALFGAFGLVMLWWMLARLASRRVAWLAFGVLLTTPLYLLVARQAITDIPMVATIIGAIACFAMSVSDRGGEPLRPLWRRVTAQHVFLALVGLFVVSQAVYHLAYFHHRPTLARGIVVPAPGWLLGGGALALYGGLVAWHIWQPARSRSAVYLSWALAMLGLCALAKGPLALLPLLIAGLYLALAARWRVLADCNVYRGLVAGLLISVPWHLAMYLKDGRAWFKEYFAYHMSTRLVEGAHQTGGSGTFDYFSSVLGIGMWPWGVLVPAALAAVLLSVARRGRHQDVRLLAGIWAMAAFWLFAISKTKFHHYILPAVPALAILIAFWIDDVIEGKGGRVALLALLGAALSLLITRDLLAEPKQIIELFIYRYDRPWPGGKPWFVDVSGPIFAFGVAGGAAVLLLAVPGRRLRPFALAGLFAVATGFALWATNGYMEKAAPHWGQRELHRTYYAKRNIHGVEIKYWSLRDLADQWNRHKGELRVDSLLPDHFRVGLPQTIRLLVPGAGVPGDAVELRGHVSRIGEDAFWIRTSEEERAQLAELIARGKRAGVARGRPPWMQVDADRLIAWQLNWRGENFWSGGEIYGETADTRTVFINTNNEEFLKYVKDESRHGRRFFVITEAQRAATLKNTLPTEQGKQTVKVVDTSCNKFTLLEFVL